VNKADLFLGIVAVVGPFAAYWATTRHSRKTEDAKAKIEGRTVEGEAYDRARKIDQEVVGGLRQELERLKSELQEERKGRIADSRRHAEELADLRSQHAEEIAALRSVVNTLKTELHVTRTQLGMPGVAPPAEEAGS
jgi:chromosome segregation ATPase